MSHLEVVAAIIINNGEILCMHISHTWLRSQSLETLDWAQADMPIVKKLMEVMRI